MSSEPETRSEGAPPSSAVVDDADFQEVISLSRAFGVGSVIALVGSFAVPMLRKGGGAPRLAFMMSKCVAPRAREFAARNECLSGAR